MSEILKLSLRELSEGVRKGTFSAVEVVAAYLGEIKRREPQIHAFITVCEKEAVAAAKRIKPGGKGKLLGVPIAVKDIIVTRGIRTTAGSKILSEFVPPYDATVIKKILDEGGIVIGKTNLDEFAMGSSTENSAYGVTKNPHDLARVPGGSSGGSAAAVAAGMVPAALGTDTGGSIRQPAGFCGVVGLCPTYGAVSRYGLISNTSSLDQIGPFARTVADVHDLFTVLKGRDPYDATSVEMISPEPKRLENLRIGIPKEYFGDVVDKASAVAGASFGEGLDPRIAKRVREVAGFLSSQGARVEEVSLPSVPYALSAYYIINPAEISSNLARFDGVRYGMREEGGDLLSQICRSRGVGFGVEVKRRILLGTFALSAGYADQFYLRAAKVRTLIVRDFQAAFEQADVLLAPVSPTLPFKFGEKSDPLAMYLSDVFTIPSKLAGLPGLAVPAGSSKNLPVGVQLIGPKFSEELLFSVGEVVEGEKWPS